MSRIKQDLSITRASVQSTNQNSRDNDTMLRRVLPLNTQPKVCVVGAGVAGLRCADYLLEKGFNVTLLEARDRVGGRVSTVYFYVSEITPYAL
jgi:NADPH-dependent 2,4-dienoyl-CoA reductase/sulfur reductase-like enzyme